MEAGFVMRFFAWKAVLKTVRFNAFLFFPFLPARLITQSKKVGCLPLSDLSHFTRTPEKPGQCRSLFRGGGGNQTKQKKHSARLNSRQARAQLGAGPRTRLGLRVNLCSVQRRHRAGRVRAAGRPPPAACTSSTSPAQPPPPGRALDACARFVSPSQRFPAQTCPSFRALGREKEESEFDNFFCSSSGTFSNLLPCAWARVKNGSRTLSRRRGARALPAQSVSPSVNPPPMMQANLARPWRVFPARPRETTS